MNIWAYIIIAIIVIIAIFLICREVVCWYWKINERRDILQSINSEISTMKHDNKQNEMISLLRSINSNLSEIAANTKNQKIVVNNSVVDKKQSVESTPVSTTSDAEQDEYTLVHRNGRIFAMKNGKLFCTNCHAAVTSEVSSMCSNCGKSLME